MNCWGSLNGGSPRTNTYTLDTELLWIAIVRYVNCTRSAAILRANQRGDVISLRILFNLILGFKRQLWGTGVAGACQMAFFIGHVRRPYIQWPTAKFPTGWTRLVSIVVNYRSDSVQDNEGTVAALELLEQKILAVIREANQCIANQDFSLFWRRFGRCPLDARVSSSLELDAFIWWSCYNYLDLLVDKCCFLTSVVAPATHYRCSAFGMTTTVFEGNVRWVWISRSLAWLSFGFHRISSARLTLPLAPRSQSSFQFILYYSWHWVPQFQTDKCCSFLNQMRQLKHR